MNYIVLDLEATCWQNKRHQPNEIIEIGAVCIDENETILDEFVTFVKPQIHPILSDFCIELTSIEQKMVDDAPYFPEAIQKFQEWILSFGNDYCLCSWGFYDKQQFEKDCILHQVDTTWLNKHISLKHQYPKIKGTKKRLGMKNALKAEGMNLEGTHHRGIDDARNIAKIFLKYFSDWEIED